MVSAKTCWFEEMSRYKDGIITVKQAQNGQNRTKSDQKRPYSRIFPDFLRYRTIE